MKLRVRESLVATEPVEPATPSHADRALVLVAPIVVAVAVMAFFLAIYPAKDRSVPMGWDTSRYVWRTALVQDVGLSGLPHAVPARINADAGRPGFPVISAVLGPATGTTTFRIAAVLPAVAAAGIGLSAGAFVTAVFRRRPWEGAVAAFAVGTSTLVVRLAGPETYQDNMLGGAVLMAASLAVVLGVRHRGATVAAIALLGVGGLIHGPFLGFLLGVLGLTALVFLPSSWRRWRSGHETPFDTTTGRLAVMIGGGAAVAGAGIYGLLASSSRPPRLSRSEFAKKLRLDLPRYRFPLLLPAAGLGVAALAVGDPAVPEDREDVRTRWFALGFLAIWAAVSLAAIPAFQVVHLNIPAHRFLAFALPLPLLGVVGVLWVGRLVGRRTTRAVGVAVAVAVVLAASAVSLRQWLSTPAWMDPAKVAAASSAARYLDAAGIPPDRPVVFVVNSSDWNYAALMGHMIRASLPPARIERTFVYDGSPSNYLARQPSGPPETGAAISRQYFERMEEAYGGDPVGLIVEPFNNTFYAAWVSQHPDTVVAPHVAVVGGPPLPAPLPAAVSPVAPYGSVKLGLLAVAILAILGLVGAGWAVAMLGRWLRGWEVLAIAPAVGIAVVALAGIALDRIGIRLDGPAPSALALAVPLAAGWGVAAWTGRRARGRRTGKTAFLANST